MAGVRQRIKVLIRSRECLQREFQAVRRKVPTIRRRERKQELVSGGFAKCQSSAEERNRNERTIGLIDVNRKRGDTAVTPSQCLGIARVKVKVIDKASKTKTRRLLSPEDDHDRPGQSLSATLLR